jgi:methanogenic corrinoid protein MtbC1
MVRLIVAGVAPKDAATKALELNLKGGQNKVEKFIQKSEDQSDLVSLLFKSTLKFDQGKIEKIIRKSISENGVEQTWVEVISPLLVLVGDEWVRTGTGIEIEHFLSEVLRKILSENLGTISRPKNSRPVLLACVENEMHSLALLVLAAVLAEARIECIFLGARTPQSALNQVIIKSAPPAIFLWAQLSENADHKYVKSIPALRPAPRVLLGGPGWKSSKVTSSNRLVITEGLRDAREQIIEALAV